MPPQRGVSNVMARLGWPQPYRDQLAALFAPAEVTFVDRRDEAGVTRLLQSCDVAIVDGVLDARYLDAPRLKWAHCDQSGIDGFAPERLARSGLIVTSSKGRSAPVLAEHAVFFMLSLCYRSRDLLRAQRRRIWGLRDQEAMRGLHGRRVCIVGYGATGTSLARLCLAFGMDVVTYRRKADPGPLPDVRVFARDGGDMLKQAIGGADFVVLCASLNDASFGMVGAKEIALMRPGGYLVNMARAQLVDETSMIEALRTGQLGGAGLDVADPQEPLPPWHRLWSAPNVLLTPHVTPQMPDRTARTLALLADNLARYRIGEDLRHAFTEEDVFTPRAAAKPFRGAHRLMQAWGWIGSRLR